MSVSVSRGPYGDSIRRVRNVKAACRFSGCGQGRVAEFLLWSIAAVTSAAPAVAQQVGEVFRDCDVCPEMFVVSAGSFMMTPSLPTPARHERSKRLE